MADDKPEAAQSAAASTDDIVERWWTDNFPGSRVALYVDIWNHAYAAKEQLKTLLRKGK